MVLYVTCLLFPRPTEANGKQTGLKPIANASRGEGQVSGLSREVRGGLLLLSSFLQSNWNVTRVETELVLDWKG